MHRSFLKKPIHDRENASDCFSNMLQYVHMTPPRTPLSIWPRGISRSRGARTATAAAGTCIDPKRVPPMAHAPAIPLATHPFLALRLHNFLHDGEMHGISYAAAGRVAFSQQVAPVVGSQGNSNVAFSTVRCVGRRRHFDWRTFHGEGG